MRYKNGPRSTRNDDNDYNIHQEDTYPVQNMEIWLEIAIYVAICSIGPLVPMDEIRLFPL